MTVAAIIPTFQPDAGEVLQLLKTLRDNAVPVMVSDDASPATSDVALRAIAAAGVPVLRHRRNAGIARGLNDGLQFAVEQGAKWLLTVDQDSAIPTRHVADLLSTAETSPSIGVVGVETIGDASGQLTYPSRLNDGLLVTEEVFQTGSLWSVAALLEISGFDERLGIDAVDAAACLRMRERGRVVALAPGTTLAHRYGSGRPVSLLGRTVVSTGHAPERRESMVRNRLALAPAEFRQSPTHAFRTLRRVAVNVALSVTVEEHRLANFSAGMRGLLRRRHPADGSQPAVAGD